jgi:hypothetical protein
MRSGLPQFPFAHSVRVARWPFDIPQSERRIWKDSPKNFSALWRVPVGAGLDSLRIELPGRFLVIAVRRGAIRLSHGGTTVHLSQGQAAAVSVPEVQAQFPDYPKGECIFVIYLFQRMPAPEQLGKGSLQAGFVMKQGRHPPGIFPFANAALLLIEGLPGGAVLDNTAALLLRLHCCGLQSAVRFIASGQGRCAAESLKPLSSGRSLAHLPMPGTELAW